MSANVRGLLRAAVRGLAVEPGSDAELLGRFVAGRDEDAFAALVRRHGPMVQAVCRRRLGAGADADDAFQVTFMVLARDAAKIARRESVAGWLFRVASLAALKVSGKLGRRPGPLADEPPDRSIGPAAEAESAELRDALDRELAALPDRLRAVVVLCGLEDRTNTEAAAILGCPTGTVDSRLSTARARLRDRLTRRGFALGSLVSLDALLKPGGAVSAELIERATTRAITYSAGRAIPGSLTSLADGVSPTMSTINVKLLVAAGMSLALFGSAGVGLYHAGAQDRAKPPAIAKQAGPDKNDVLPITQVPASEEKARQRPPVLKDEAAVWAALAKPLELPPVDNIPLRELLQQIYMEHGIIARLDIAAFARTGNPIDFGPTEFYDMKVNIPLTQGMTVGELLTEALASLGHYAKESRSPMGIWTFRVRGDQLSIVRAYTPPALPVLGSASGEPVVHAVEQKVLIEQIVGEPVSLAVEEKPFNEVVKEIRKLTGANIVIDSRCKEEASQPVSGTFNDTRLLTVLQVLGDMCDLKPVPMNNVYYLTTPANADRLLEEVRKDLFGSPPQQVPAGFVTDGIRLYERPGSLKPADQFGLGGGVSGFVPGPAPVPMPVEKKPDEKK